MQFLNIQQFYNSETEQYIVLFVNDTIKYWYKLIFPQSSKSYALFLEIFQVNPLHWYK